MKYTMSGQALTIALSLTVSEFAVGDDVEEVVLSADLAGAVYSNQPRAFEQAQWLSEQVLTGVETGIEAQHGVEIIPVHYRRYRHHHRYRFHRPHHRHHFYRGYYRPYGSYPHSGFRSGRHRHFNHYHGRRSRRHH